MLTGFSSRKSSVSEERSGSILSNSTWRSPRFTKIFFPKLWLPFRPSDSRIIRRSVRPNGPPERSARTACSTDLLDRFARPVCPTDLPDRSRPIPKAIAAQPPPAIAPKSRKPIAAGAEPLATAAARRPRRCWAQCDRLIFKFWIHFVGGSPAPRALGTHRPPPILPQVPAEVLPWTN